MNQIIIPIFVILVIVIILMLIIKIAELSKKVKSAGNAETNNENNEVTTIDNYPYHRKYLLTANECGFYKSLKPIADKYSIHILSKVRISDIIEVNKGLNNSERTTAFNKIKSKHFDFVITDPKNLYVLCAIELDDKSHERIDRQQRDYFIDKLCETVNLPIIHCTDINGVEDQICEKLKIHKK